MNSDLQAKDRQYLWHPYTQMHDYATRELLCIDRADGLFLYDQSGKPYYDTISSWWCIVHGHNHPTVMGAIRRQLERLDQVLLAGATHEPAVLLAEQLVQRTPPRLTKVFYSDNGSTACEIAVKMSVQYWRQNGRPERTRMVGLTRGYHGDTIGTMSLGGVPEFHQAFSGMLFDSYRLPSPSCYRCPAGRQQATCDCECLAPYEALLAEHGREIAALIIEPLIQATGGMIIYPARYLARIAALTQAHGVHLILDEVATGFGRTGTFFALEQAGISPDFLCLSKGLTGGCLPMAATLTTDEIYQGFYGEYRAGRTFFHGHTFTGNPLAAAAALGSLQVFAEEDTMAGLPAKIDHLRQRLARFADLPWVGEVRQLGLIAALELVKDKAGKVPFAPEERVGWPIYLKGLEEGLLLRPMGNVVYLWLPLAVTTTAIDEISERMWRVLADPTNIAGMGR